MRNRKMQYSGELSEFLSFCTDPTSYCIYSEKMLLENGFVKIDESKLPNEVPKKGFFIRSNKTIAAYHIGGYESFVISAAHSDSPCIKLKPNFEKSLDLYQVLNLLNYAGGLSHTMYGRNLKLTGLVYFTEGDVLKTKYIDSGRPIGFIPFPEVSINPTFSCRPVTDRNINMNIVFGTNGCRPLVDLLSEISGVSKDNIVSSDLYLTDSKPPSICGDFLASGRLDNLASSFCVIKSFLQSEPKDTVNIMIVFDNEEIGSHSFNGALGDMCERIIRFVTKGTNKSVENIKSTSLIISCDAAHGKHPNYIDGNDKNHPTKIGHGVVLKGVGKNTTCLNKRGYLMIHEAARKSKSNITTMVKKNGRGGGGTVGPKMEMLNGISTIDIGIPVFGMHSYRETMACVDCKRHIEILSTIYNNYTSMRLNIEANPLHSDETI